MVLRDAFEGYTTLAVESVDLKLALVGCPRLVLLYRHVADHVLTTSCGLPLTSPLPIVRFGLSMRANSYMASRSSIGMRKRGDWSSLSRSAIFWVLF